MLGGRKPPSHLGTVLRVLLPRLDRAVEHGPRLEQLDLDLRDLLLNGRQLGNGRFHPGRLALPGIVDREVARGAGNAEVDRAADQPPAADGRVWGFLAGR